MNRKLLLLPLMFLLLCFGMAAWAQDYDDDYDADMDSLITSAIHGSGTTNANERIIRFQTVSMDKHAVAYAERRRAKLNAPKPEAPAEEQSAE